MLKLESAYKTNFPKNKDSRMSSLASTPLLDYMGVFIGGVPSESEQAPNEASEITTCIDNIMILPEDEYEEIWEVTSPRPIVTVKAATNGVLGK